MQYRSVWLIVAIAIACSLSRVDAGGWPAELRSGTILYRADFPLDGIGDTLDEVTRLRQEISQQLRLEASSEPIHVYLFHHPSVYERYLRQYFPSVPSRRALFIKDRGPGMVFAYRSDEFSIDLRHESTHAVLHTMLPLVPLWLDEGLAEYYEVPTSDRYAGNPHLKAIQRSVKWRVIPRLSDLEELTDLEQMKHDDYRDAWAWTHYLLHGPPEVQMEFQRYLADIQSHIPPGKLSHRISRRERNVSASFTAHFRRL